MWVTIAKINSSTQPDWHELFLLQRTGCLLRNIHWESTERWAMHYGTMFPYLIGVSDSSKQVIKMYQVFHDWTPNLSPTPASDFFYSSHQKVVTLHNLNYPDFTQAVPSSHASHFPLVKGLRIFKGPVHTVPLPWDLPRLPIPECEQSFSFSFQFHITYIPYNSSYINLTYSGLNSGDAYFHNQLIL